MGADGTDTVWHRIDRELRRRRDAHLLPGTWAALGRRIGAKAQALTNWKTRGVPPKQYPAIAGALDWSVDQLLGLADTAVGDSPFSPDTMHVAKQYQEMNMSERERFRRLLLAAQEPRPDDLETRRKAAAEEKETTEIAEAVRSLRKRALAKRAPREEMGIIAGAKTRIRGHKPSKSTRKKGTK